MTVTAADMDHACTLLQLQSEFIDSLQREIGILRAERDDARNLRAMFRELIDTVGQKLKRTKICVQCHLPFETAKKYATVCPSCRSIMARARSLKTAAERLATV